MRLSYLRRDSLSEELAALGLETDAVAFDRIGDGRAEPVLPSVERFDEILDQPEVGSGVEGLSEKFNKEYWNYAKLISGVLRYRMPLEHVIKLVGSLQLESESINTWKNGVERALKKYITDGTEAKGMKCPNCGHESLVYQEGCLICKHCGASRCG